MQPVPFESTEHTIDPDIFTASAEYDRRFDSPVGAYFLETQRNAVLRLLERYNGSSLKILELGGGHLQLTEHLLALGHQVTVHASRPEGLQKLEQSPLRGRVARLVLPLSELPSLNEHFDAVITLRLIPHVQNLQSLLEQISRLSKRVAIFDYAASHGFNALSPLLFQMKRNIEKNTRPYFCHSPKQIDRILYGLHFLQTQAIPQFFLPMGLHRKLGSAPLSRITESIASVTGLTSIAGSPIVMGAFR